MAKSSINFKAVSINSERHNERIEELDYNFKNLEKNNDSWKEESIPDRRKKIERIARELNGKKIYKNATPIREAVVNLNANHTIEDLKKLASELEGKFEIKCFQIHIHRDEGKSEKELNYHAHMIFDWQNKNTGKMLRLKKLDLSKIQTLVANSLGMERGELKVNSNRERLEPIEYKRQQEEKRLKQLQEKIEIMEQKKNTASERNREARAKHQEAIRRVNKEFERFEAVWERFVETGDISVVKKEKDRERVLERLKGRVYQSYSEIKRIETEGYILEEQQTEIRTTKKQIESTERVLASYARAFKNQDSSFFSPKNISPEHRKKLSETVKKIHEELG